MRAQLIDDPEAARRLWADWDALAVQASLPYATPAWQLGWWTAAAPERARLRVLAARDDAGAVVGVLGLFGERTPTGGERLRLLGAPLAQGMAPLAVAGREAEVAAAFAGALAVLRPLPATLELEGVPDGERWARMLRDGWPGRARPPVQFLRDVTAPAAGTSGAATLDAWLKGRSSNFRSQMRRSRRGLDERGGVLRRARTAPEIEAVLPRLLELHHARWRDRGGSAAVDDGTHAVLVEAVRGLAPDRRAHAEIIECDGAVISAHLFFSAGEETTYWLGGFDDAYAAERPGLLALLGALEDVIERGATRLDLGPGTDQYKARLADRERTLAWRRLVLPGPRLPLTLLELAPRRVARAAADRLGPERQRALRDRVRRLRGSS